MPGNLFLPDVENSWRKSRQVIGVREVCRGKGILGQV